MMTDDRVSGATALSRTSHHILYGAVVLNHIKIGRSKIIDMMSQILGNYLSQGQWFSSPLSDPGRKIPEEMK